MLALGLWDHIDYNTVDAPATLSTTTAAPVQTPNEFLADNSLAASLVPVA